MPIIASFFGIYVRMYFADHGPPHIHVEYQGHEALLTIADGAILQGVAATRACVGQAVVPRSPRRTGAELGQGAGSTAIESHPGSRQ